MDAEFWLQRWREGRTGWHRDAVMPLLEQHWPALNVARDARVLVPLCGKTLDMLWLAEQGLRVRGVELSPLAVEAFLAEHQLHARARSGNDGTRYEVTNAPDGGAIEIINGDAFAVDAATYAECTAFYDRAASIAFPAALRERLANEVYAHLPAGSRGLLITLEYPPTQKEGPPFPIDAAEVERLYARDWLIEQVDRRDILASQPGFAAEGVTALHTAVYTLTRRAT